MTPLARVGTGMLLVVVDVRLGGPDVVLDPVGWVFVLAGLVPLAGRQPWFAAATAAAVVGGLVSLPGVVAEPGGWLAVVDTVASTVLVFATCTGVLRLLGDDPAAATANHIRWADLLLTVVTAALALAAVGTGSGGEDALILVPLAIAALAVVIWFIVFLFKVGRHPGLLAESPALV